MTTTTAIIKRAYRESNLIALGFDPSTAQNTEGLELLASMVAGVFGFDTGEKLHDWTVGTVGQEDPDNSWTEQDWKYPRSNSRILLAHTTAQTIYLPEDPDNGARIQIVDVHGALATYNVTLNGNGRSIQSALTQVLNTNDLVRTWFYNADTADWVIVQGLALAVEMPFPTEFDDYFIIKLAGRINPRYGRALTAESLMRLQELQGMLEARYKQTSAVGAPNALQRLTSPFSNRFRLGPRGGRSGWMV